MEDSLKNNSSNKTKDGFISVYGSAVQQGLDTSAVTESSDISNEKQYDVIIIGAGFAGLIAARELTLRGKSVLIVEGKDRIGGRTFTANYDQKTFEIGGTWIHWSQPHVWTEITRYGLSLKQSQGGQSEQLAVLLDNGANLSHKSSRYCWTAMGKLMNAYSDVDGVQGRNIIPLPHSPLVNYELVSKFDQLSMKDRLDQIAETLKVDDEVYQMFLSLLSMNMQGDLNEGGFIDHLRWWALGDYDMELMFDKLGRYKIKEGTTALARAILNDCRDVKLLFSTWISSIDRTNSEQIKIQTSDGRLIRGRTVLITAPLNVLSKIEFNPPLDEAKHTAIAKGQCRGGVKFWAKLSKPIGNWFAFAAYPNPITMAYTDDDEGSIVVGFGPENRLQIDDASSVQNELRKFLPEINIEYVLSHDWRNDSLVMGTWSWYKVKQMSSDLEILRKAEPPVFFASGDLANGWRGFIDGAIESGLEAAKDICNYLQK